MTYTPDSLRAAPVRAYPTDRDALVELAAHLTAHADAWEATERARAGQAAEVVRLKRMIEGLAAENAALRELLEAPDRRADVDKTMDAVTSKQRRDHEAVEALIRLHKS